MKKDKTSHEVIDLLNQLTELSNKFKKLTEKLSFDELHDVQHKLAETACPHCGYCPTCGRSNTYYTQWHWTIPIYPSYPLSPSSPLYPTITSGGATSSTVTTWTIGSYSGHQI